MTHPVIPGRVMRSGYLATFSESGTPLAPV
jgi:hypothetical protein